MHILRQSLLGLLSLMLVLPASALHVCRCSQSAAAVVPEPVTEAPLRPCCAKRLAASGKKPVQSSSSDIKAKCCCDELRRSQTITQTPPSRAPMPSLLPTLSGLKHEVADQRPDLTADRQVVAVERVPDDPMRITLGRWQI